MMLPIGTRCINCIFLAGREGMNDIRLSNANGSALITNFESKVSPLEVETCQKHFKFFIIGVKVMRITILNCIVMHAITLPSDSLHLGLLIVVANLLS